VVAGVKHPALAGSAHGDDSGGTLLFVSLQLWTARASWWRLFPQVLRAAASRTFWTAGRRRPIRMAMMAMTTNNSISVNPDRGRDGDMNHLLNREYGTKPRER
jgi:hypothetical protein